MSKLKTTYKELKPSDLRWSCPVKYFKFKTTANLKPLNEIVGQPRAIEAIRLGSELQSKGYNIFVSGLAGTGRLTTVKMILEKMPMLEPKLFDFCFVNNFSEHEAPRLVRLPKGKGKVFSKAIDDAIEFLRNHLPKIFDDEKFQSERKHLIESYQKREHNILKQFDDRIQKDNFVRGQIETDEGVTQADIFPLVEGEAVAIQLLNEYVVNKKISNKQAEDIYKKYTKYKNQLLEIGKKQIKLMTEFKQAIAKNDKARIATTVNSVLDDIKNQFKNEKVNIFIDEVKKFIMDNIMFFVPGASFLNPATQIDENIKNNVFRLFKVNVIVDNSGNEKPPIIIERTPSYTNLFGAIERTVDKNGAWHTDFSKIRAGSILKADGGFLIVNAADLFEEAGVWQALKRVLLYDRLEIQTFESILQFSQVYIKPEPIKVNVKIVIIGGLTLYKMLYEYEKGFKKIFKINAQFDYEAKRNTEMIKNYARFAAKICKEENLPPFTPDGVAALVEWGVEHAGSVDKITLKFSDVADIIREAAFYDKYSTKKYINREDVEKAIVMQRYRNNLWDEKMKGSILEGTIMIDVKGKRVGQINALTILDDGLISFGKPSRITATVSVGTAGIINIEREADMSGSIHNKGVLIITNFFRENFAQKKSLSFTASLAFEQNYGGIDGDSASAAEIYVLISALIKVPVNQSFALTGSMNQKGDIQPIGGVNEKITGFYEICKEKGLTGEQGVLIPELNVMDLMLRKEIVDDVKAGKFKIYTFKRIEEGMELILGMSACKQDKNGIYPEGTVYRMITDRLNELSALAKDKKPKKKNLQSKKSGK